MADDIVIRNPEIEKRLLEYILAVTSAASQWWDEREGGSVLIRKDSFKEYRQRYDARRSVAELNKDSKNSPFPNSSNIGIGIEQIFGEFLIPTFLANTIDLEPCMQAVDETTEKVDEALTEFHNNYYKSPGLRIRTLMEESDREILKVGGVFHKWTWGSVWKQTEYPLYVFGDPMTRQPVFVPDASGGMSPIPADPKMPEEFWPKGPDGRKLKIINASAVKHVLDREGPVLSVRPCETMEFPLSAKTVDPNDWDWIADNFTVSPWWFLGREGDPFDGKLQNIDKLWKFLKIDPNTVYLRPDKRLTDPVKMKEWHGKFPMTTSGRPIEIVALVATDARLLLGWRASPFVRRPYFNRQVWSRCDYPIGKGIPETNWSLRNAADALINQEVDYGNIYGHPPMLLSSLAMLEDEDYEQVGPGSQWVMQDINGAKFLSVPPTTRNILEVENWLISMMQRLWGVTDLNLNAPTSSLSPNVSTATGTMAILNQGNLKFGHLTKRLSEVDSDEHQFRHDMFRTMMSNASTISVKGKPVTINPQDRESFFGTHIRVRARGDGITTNPIMRQQALNQARQIFAQDPFIVGDLEVLKDLDEQILSAFGLKLNLKDPQILQELKLIEQVIKIPEGRRLIGEAVQQIQMLVAQSQVAKGKGGNGVSPVPA